MLQEKGLYMYGEEDASSKNTDYVVHNSKTICCLIYMYSHVDIYGARSIHNMFQVLVYPLHWQGPYACFD